MDQITFKALAVILREIDTQTLVKACKELIYKSTSRNESSCSEEKNVELEQLFSECSNDNCVQLYNTLHLDNPQNLVEVLMLTAQYELAYVHDALETLRDENLQRSVAKVQSGINHYQLALDNPPDADEFLKTAESELLNGINEIQNSIPGYIKDVSDYANKHGLEKILLAPIRIQNIDSNMHRCQNALSALERAVEAYLLVAKMRNINVLVIYDRYINFMNQNILNKSAYAILQDYCKKENELFWKCLPQKYLEIPKVILEIPNTTH